MSTEEPTQAELHARIEQLEQQVEALTPEEISRREGLKALVAAGTAIGAGGAGYAAFTEDARAAPDPNDSDSNVGKPSEAVDAWLSGAEFQGDAQDDDGNTLIDESVPAWLQQVGTAGSPAPPSHFQSFTVGSNDYDIDEDGNGDLVIRDDNGNDVLIWDKSAGQWDFKSQDIANIASLDTGNALLDGDPVLAEPASTSQASVSLGGGWTTEDANQPVRLLFRVVVYTDGTSDSAVRLEVDRSGKTSSDYSLTMATGTEHPDDSFNNFIFPITIPAGAQIRFVNALDPKSKNKISNKRKAVVSS